MSAGRAPVTPSCKGQIRVREGEVALVAVVEAAQRPAVTFELGAEVAPVEEVLVGQRSAVPGGECSAADRVEDREARRRPGHPSQLDEAVVRLGEVVDDACGKDRVAGAVSEGEADRVGEDERSVPIAPGVSGRRQHLPGDVDGDDQPRFAHVLAKAAAARGRYPRRGRARCRRAAEPARPRPGRRPVRRPGTGRPRSPHGRRRTPVPRRVAERSCGQCAVVTTRSTSRPGPGDAIIRIVAG